MEIAILFWTMTVAACGYAVVFGSWEGKCTTAIIALAAIFTLLSDTWLGIKWHETNVSVFIIDTSAFFAMYLVAAGSRHWWPLWAAAFQLNSVAAHVATMLSPHFSYLVYQQYAGLWAIPGQLVMVAGIYLDRLGKYPMSAPETANRFEAATAFPRDPTASGSATN